MWVLYKVPRAAGAWSNALNAQFFKVKGFISYLKLSFLPGSLPKPVLTETNIRAFLFLLTAPTVCCLQVVVEVCPGPMKGREKRIDADRDGCKCGFMDPIVESRNLGCCTIRPCCSSLWFLLRHSKESGLWLCCACGKEQLVANLWKPFYGSTFFHSDSFNPAFVNKHPIILPLYHFKPQNSSYVFSELQVCFLIIKRII